MKRLILASFAMVAMLASCEKENVIDSALVNNKEIKFAPYAGASATRGTAVGTNGDFKGDGTTAKPYGSFKVAAYNAEVEYFGFRQVSWDGSEWVNQNSMYWPNENATLHFGAYYPYGSTQIDGTPTFEHTASANALEFDYNVAAEVDDQEDLMYAISDYSYLAPTGSELTSDADDAVVGLHFKHALTQIAFTATKSSDIKVTVKSIKICNVVNNGSFSASANTNDSGSINTDQNESDATSAGATIWTDKTAPIAAADLSNYAVEMDYVSPATGIEVDPSNTAAKTDLSIGGNVMMLLPQALTKWNPKAASGSTEDFIDGTASYLAIKCKITHSDGTAPIIEGTIYVPFGTENIVYDATTTASRWLPGYKLTYNLDFGGGYTFPGNPDSDDPNGPTPGKTPNPDKVIETLRKVKYTVTVDAWKPVTVTPDVAM